MSFHIIQFPRTYLCNIFGENSSVEAPDLQTCQMFPCCYIFLGSGTLGIIDCTKRYSSNETILDMYFEKFEKIFLKVSLWLN